jgi:hypothetical protein
MCQRWGVRVVFGPLEGPAVTRMLGRPADWVLDEDRTSAPQSHSWLYWRRSIIVWNDRMADFEAGNLLHELVHAILPVAPDAVDEVHGPFLWLEYALARVCKVPRTAVMEGYLIEDPVEWQELTSRAKGRYLHESFEEACALGVATPSGGLSFVNLSPGSPHGGRRNGSVRR